MLVNPPVSSRRAFLQNTATTAVLAGSAGGSILGTMMGAGIGLLRQGTSETPKEQPKPNEPSKDTGRKKQRAWVRPEEVRAPVTWFTENVVANDALTGGLVGAGTGATGGLVIENKIFGEYPEDCDGWPSKES